MKGFVCAAEAAGGRTEAAALVAECWLSCSGSVLFGLSWMVLSEKPKPMHNAAVAAMAGKARSLTPYLPFLLLVCKFILSLHEIYLMACSVL